MKSTIPRSFCFLLRFSAFFNVISSNAKNLFLIFYYIGENFPIDSPYFIAKSFHSSALYENYACDIKETRILGATSYFYNLFFQKLNELNDMIYKTQKYKKILKIAMNFMQIMGYGLVIALTMYYVVKGDISVGAFTAVLSTMGRLYDFMGEVISERIGWAFENISNVQNFFNFLEEDFERNKVIYKKNLSSIELKNVSFKYPLSESDAVNEINLDIKNGETVALIGMNGSGKSTLCKLLLGLYTPTKGEISFGGVFENAMKGLNASAVFQDFCRYNISLRENICISDLYKQIDAETFREFCVFNDIDINMFASGENTVLGREFDGVELSGGQWQNIAIARGIFKDSSLIILDEPTAAIDPLEEKNLYNSFYKICKDKTAIIVSHRLSSVQIADRILVMDKGRIVEDGTHEQLLLKDGLYTKMYNLQKDTYIQL